MLNHRIPSHDNNTMHISAALEFRRRSTFKSFTEDESSTDPVTPQRMPRSISVSDTPVEIQTRVRFAMNSPPEPTPSTLQRAFSTASLASDYIPITPQQSHDRPESREPSIAPLPTPAAITPSDQVAVTVPKKKEYVLIMDGQTVAFALEHCPRLFYTLSLFVLF